MKSDRNPESIKFSIITVCRNEERTIRATIESVLNQRWHNLEYIIADGASWDATLEIIKQYAGKDKRIRWISEKDSGIYNAMNRGIQLAEGEFLYFLNAGDTLHNDSVLEKISDIAAEADIVIGNIGMKSDAEIAEHSYSVGEELRQNLEKCQNVCHQVIFASKRCLEDGFDEQFQICADYDWLCRQVCSGKKIIKADMTVVDYDMHGVSNQLQYEKLRWKERFRVIEKNFPALKFKYGEEIKKLIIRERKELHECRFMNRWLFLKQRGIAFSAFFLQKGVYSIAVYGSHYMGQRLYDELKGSGVDVKYVIDRKPDKDNWEIPAVHPEDTLGAVDAVVITPVFDFLEIRAMLLKKLDCLMIPVEEMLFYDYERADDQTYTKPDQEV